MTNTPHGTLVTFRKEDAAKALLADMIYLEKRSEPTTAPQILPVLGAITGVLGTAIAAGQLGISAANLVNSTSGSLEVEVRNLGTNSIAPFSYDTDGADMTSFPGPIVPGASDNIVVTKSGGFDAGSTNFSVEMLVAGNKATKAISVKLKLVFSSAGLWQLTATVDGQTEDFPAELGLVGLKFTGNSPFPSFNLYFSSIETGNGDLQISIFNPGE